MVEQNRQNRSQNRTTEKVCSDSFEKGKYAAIHGPNSTVKKFKNSHPHLNQSVKNFRIQLIRHLPDIFQR